MKKIKAIAAMAENRVIGNQGQIPWHLPEDFRWFKQATMGGVLVMGRKTYESIGKNLIGRKLIILTSDPYYQATDCKVATSIDARSSAK